MLALLLLFKRKLPFTIKKNDFKINEHCKRALKTGLPLALQECLTQISFLALCAFRKCFWTLRHPQAMELPVSL